MAMLKLCPRARQLGALGVMMLGLAGCSTISGRQSPALEPQVAFVPPPPRADDPLAAFAGRASLGQEELIGNPQVSARLIRTYNSGGGRPCRELLVGSANTGIQSLYCQDAAGQWSAVRPLLRNGLASQS
jgi:hypothetical protein